MERFIFLEHERCIGCHACVAACVDQNDMHVEEGIAEWRRVCRIEDGDYHNSIITYVSLSCMHCEDAPCVMGCPTGALSKDRETQLVLVDSELCIGCRSCALACPFAIPRFGETDRMQKCNMCYERVECGLEPACVRVCPTGALRFLPIRERGLAEAEKTARRLVAASKTRRR